MPAKPTSTAGKAPASTASKAPAKTTSETKAKKATKTSSTDPDAKKKRRKTRKETYSSYIYKGTRFLLIDALPLVLIPLSSPQAGPPRYWHLEQGHGHLELFRQRYL